MIQARIINFDEGSIKNDKTGEIKKVYYVNLEVPVEPYKGHHGPEIMQSCTSESAFEILEKNCGKDVRIELSEKKVFGKQNQYKKVVSTINGINVRKF